MDNSHWGMRVPKRIVIPTGNEEIIVEDGQLMKFPLLYISDLQGKGDIDKWIGLLARTQWAINATKE